MGFLLSFFLRNGIHSKRTIWMMVLALIPVGCALILLMTKPFLEKQGILLSSLFPQVSLLLFLHFLLPLISLFIGTAIIADEVEERTLPYLLVRPTPRGVVILTKTLAGIITGGLILLTSLALTYSALMIGTSTSTWASNFSRLLRVSGVLLLGLLVYLPFFGFLGGTIKHPVMAGIFFAFGWESTVSFFPGNVKLFTVVHYLHILFPSMGKISSVNMKSVFLNLIMPAKQISSLASILILIGMFLLFTGLTALLLYIKEYRLEQA